MTGPNDSSIAIMLLSSTLVNTVGAKNKPVHIRKSHVAKTDNPSKTFYNARLKIFMNWVTRLFKQE